MTLEVYKSLNLRTEHNDLQRNINIELNKIYL